MVASPEKRFASIANSYPSFQNNNTIQLNAFKWMKSRQLDDNAEGLWRVHNTLYDLTDFINWHPGGSDWIRLTKGTDITEAFEVHHLNYTKAVSLLQDYRVREASSSRNFKLTFEETGFYRTLRHRVTETLKTIDTAKAESISKVYIDSLLVLTIITSVLSAYFNSIYLPILAGICMCYTVISAHNFFHRRDNIRMYYFNLAFLNYKEWRISHAMSHHLYPNSLYDLEIVLLEPILCWFPNANIKGFIQRYLSWIYSPVIYTFIFLDQLVKRTIFSITSGRNLFELCDCMPLVVPISMLLLGNSDVFVVLKIWLEIIMVSSFTFGLIGLNAGHHHPDVVHEGDKLRENLDWGLYSMDTIMDNSDFRKHHLVALTHFGHHALHHLFPTIDHGILDMLYPTLYATMDEFKVHLDCYPWYHHILGQLRQLTRVTANPIDALEKFHTKRYAQKLD